MLLQDPARRAKFLHMANPDPTPLRLAVVYSGRSQREIAAAAGIGETYFSKIVNGRLHAGDATRRKIAKAVNRRVEDLWPEDVAA